MHSGNGLRCLLQRLWLWHTLGLFLAAADTTPPVLHIEDAQPFIFHVLMTVRLNEDGTIYCGALETLSSYTPSIAQKMKSGTGLVGHDYASVTANSDVNLVVGILTPATLYDVFCYAEDLFVNGLTLAQVAGTKTSLATASGGDYTAPTFSYISPNYQVESIAMTLYFQLSEDGTVWCVAKVDTGSGTTRPLASDFLLDQNVDAWGTQTVSAALSYQASITLTGLTEDTDYDDTAGNFLDGTPALASDTSKIDATKLDVRTLAVLIASRLSVTSSPGTQYVVKPAAWNTVLPICSPATGPKRRCEADAESWRMTPLYQNVKLISEASHSSNGCFGALLAAPRHGGPFALLLRRGKCSFAQKAERALEAGYDFLLILDHRTVSSSFLPDMTTDGGSITIPTWVMSKADGEAMLLLSPAAGLVANRYLTMEIEDAHRVPSMGLYQSDVYGHECADSIAWNTIRLPDMANSSHSHPNHSGTNHSDAALDGEDVPLEMGILTQLISLIQDPFATTPTRAGSHRAAQSSQLTEDLWPCVQKRRAQAASFLAAKPGASPAPESSGDRVIRVPAGYGDGDGDGLPGQGYQGNMAGHGMAGFDQGYGYGMDESYSQPGMVNQGNYGIQGLANGTFGGASAAGAGAVGAAGGAAGAAGAGTKTVKMPAPGCNPGSCPDPPEPGMVCEPCGEVSRHMGPGPYSQYGQQAAMRRGILQRYAEIAAAGPAAFGLGAAAGADGLGSGAPSAEEECMELGIMAR
ncbi:unnamed protein product [Durusdinium trenchii]|uniref:PA domain-containing protein n=1 Tax=Durusdinium trenchii TaxID=1381693 RepID=A0ABP0JSP9_9DINO